MTTRDDTGDALDAAARRAVERIGPPSTQTRAKLALIIGPAAATVKARRAARTATRQRVTRT